MLPIAAAAAGLAAVAGIAAFLLAPPAHRSTARVPADADPDEPRPG